MGNARRAKLFNVSQRIDDMPRSHTSPGPAPLESKTRVCGGVKPTEVTGRLRGKKQRQIIEIESGFEKRNMRVKIKISVTPGGGRGALRL